MELSCWAGAALLRGRLSERAQSSCWLLSQGAYVEWSLTARGRHQAGWLAVAAAGWHLMPGLVLA